MIVRTLHVITYLQFLLLPLPVLPVCKVSLKIIPNSSASHLFLPIGAVKEVRTVNNHGHVLAVARKQPAKLPPPL